MRALGISPRDYRDMDTVVDLGPCNPCKYISWEAITQVFFNQVSFRTKLHINILFAVREPFVGRGLLRKNSIRNRGLPRRETPRKDPSICLKSFLHSFTDFGGRTSWHPLDFSKSYRYITGRQTRGFKTVHLTISRSGRNRASPREKYILLRGTESHDSVVIMA